LNGFRIDVVPTCLFIHEKKKPLKVQKNTGFCEFFICTTAGLEMRWDREITDFTIEFKDSTISGCFSPKCIDHDMM